MDNLAVQFREFDSRQDPFFLNSGSVAESVKTRVSKIQALVDDV